MLDMTESRFDNLNWFKLADIRSDGFHAALRERVSRLENPYDFKSWDAMEAASAQAWLDGWVEGNDCLQNG